MVLGVGSVAGDIRRLGGSALDWSGLPNYLWLAFTLRIMAVIVSPGDAV